MLDSETKRKGLMDPRTPEVFVDFMWPNHDKYPSFLEIELQFCNKVERTINVKHYSRAPWEREISRHDISDLLTGHREFAEEKVNLREDIKTRRWEKFENEPSQIPNKLLRKIETEKQGALRIKFSNKGRYLAIACTLGGSSLKESKTIIKIVDIEDGKEKVVLRGHHDIIHDLDWS